MHDLINFGPSKAVELLNQITTVSNTLFYEQDIKYWGTKKISSVTLSTYVSDLALSPFSLSCPPPLLVNNNDEALFENWLTVVSKSNH